MTDREDSTLKLISEEAAEWFVRIKDRDVDPAEERKYVKWLKQSPIHVAEFLRLSQNYVRYRKAELPVFGPEVGEESNIVELKRREVELSEPAAKRTTIATWKIAAAIAAVTFSLLLGVGTKIVWIDRTIETGAGEWRQIALTDGSTMRVAPLTEVKIAFSDQRRTINLLYGEAFFQVAKDKARPFYVNGGIATVRAVGTQFSVSRAKGDVVVTVSEGRVAVSPARGVDSSKALAGSRGAQVPIELPVSTDEQVKVTEQVWPTDVRKVNARNVLAWTRQQLIFDTETIAEAAAAFNRLNRIQISVDDPEIAQWRACCAFDATDPESFAETMAEESGIRLVRDSLGVLHLVAEEESEEKEGGGTENTTIQADAL